MKIFINPGHCIGADSGACGCGLQEAQVAMNIGDRVSKYLLAVGYTTKVFQYDGLDEIVDVSNYWDADLFVSIHCNAFNGYASGTETFTKGSSEGSKLANAIQNQLLQKIETIDRGVKVRGFYVIKHTAAHAVLVETAFVNNPAEPSKTFDVEKIVALARKYESNSDTALANLTN
ncbi:MAG: N-acetylmuramoyl-L-alanine amidase [Selenomonadaceae bacterium]|nr:N-acetylmuramoyl-L-alanine amidase [Selenomonadaceae bacterium]